MPDGSHSPTFLTWSDWVKRTSAPGVESPNGVLRVVDLFSGCGGMTLGAVEGARRRRKRVEVVLALDLNADAMAVYRQNFRVCEARGQLADVSDFFPGAVGQDILLTEEALAGRVGNVDLLMAGPPCQGNSDLNNRSRRTDPRNALYMKAVRAIEVLRPSFSIIENVPGVVHDRGGVADLARRSLVAMGYRVASGVVAFADFGLAQSRRRHVTLVSRCLSEGEMAEYFTPTVKRRSTIREFIGDLEREGSRRESLMDYVPSMSPANAARAVWLIENDQFDLPNELRPPCHRDKNHSYVSMYGRLSWDRPAQTITTGFGSMGQGRYVHPSRPRTLTCREAARLQGFPDYFDFGRAGSISQLREMIGNAVPPQFVAHIVSSVFV